MLSASVNTEPRRFGRGPDCNVGAKGARMDYNGSYIKSRAAFEGGRAGGILCATSRRSMDRTQASEACNVGSIPTGRIDGF